MSVIDQTQELFRNALDCRDLNLVRKIYALKPEIFNSQVSIRDAFTGACENRHLKIVRQLYEWKPTIVDSASYDRAFENACYKGHLEIVRLLYGWKPRIIDLACYDEAFKVACRYRHLEVVRLLYGWKPKIVNSTGYEDAFSCQLFDTDLVEQLIKWKPTIVDSACYDESFKKACWYACCQDPKNRASVEIFQMVILLHQWKPTIVNSAYYDNAFENACENGHLQIVRQLYEWKPTIVDSACYDEAFGKACRKNFNTEFSDIHKGKKKKKGKKKYGDVVRLLFELKPTIDLSRFYQSRFYQYRSLFESLGIILSNNLQKESIHERETLECPICMDIIQKSECMVTKCGHKFCANCINQWLKNNPECPYCRQNL